MKDLSYENHMTEWLQDPEHAAAYLTDSLALALERVLMASAKNAELPFDGLEAVCRLKPLLDGLSLHLAVTARQRAPCH
jgi:hypothetical protein